VVAASVSGEARGEGQGEVSGGWAARGYRTKWIRAHAGDTVSKVARRYGCDWRDFKRYNYDDVKGRFVVHSAAQKLPPP
jgi:hypothetical protein